MNGTPADMKTIAREIAGAQPALTTQRAIEHVARAMRVSYRRAYGFFYGEARSVSAEEWISAQKAMMQTRRLRAARLRAELATLENSMGDHDDNLETGSRVFWVDRRSRSRCGEGV